MCHVENTGTLNLPVDKRLSVTTLSTGGRWRQAEVHREVYTLPFAATFGATVPKATPTNGTLVVGQIAEVLFVFFFQAAHRA